MPISQNQTIDPVEFSYGSGEAENGLTPIKVDSGKFAGTVFTFSVMKIDNTDDGTGDGVLTYSADIHLMIQDGETVELDGFDLTEFYESTANNIIMQILKDMVSKNDTAN